LKSAITSACVAPDAAIRRLAIAILEVMAVLPAK